MKEEDIEQIKKYRNNHHRCKWCKYYSHKVKDIGMDYFSYEKCLLKDKMLTFSDLPTFCKYYSPKDINNSNFD